VLAAWPQFFIFLLSTAMIKLTRLNKSEFYLNPDLIKSIEETPDTIIKLTNDDHVLVLEKAEEVIDKIVAFRVRILQQSRHGIDTGE
jgi:flagellar protein FlbD